MGGEVNGENRPLELDLVGLADVSTDLDGLDDELAGELLGETVTGHELEAHRLASVGEAPFLDAVGFAEVGQ